MARSTPTEDLRMRLVTRDFLAELLGLDKDGEDALRSTDEGRRSDGHSTFFSVLEGRASRLRLAERPEDAIAILRRYDTHIQAYQEQIGRHRGAFQLRYFQYMAALASELWLDRLTSAPDRLWVDLENFRARDRARYGDVVLDPTRLRKVALWMATGSGKTLLLHLHLLQARRYLPRLAARTVVLAPYETLARQHLRELHASGFVEARHANDPDGASAPIQVIELSKLYVPTAGAPSTRSGGASLPTTDFEGPLLLLIDEGHKGTANKTDADVERSWRQIREALHDDQDGLTFEYSATFAQVTDKDPSIQAAYAQSILFEYAYGRFHADGFGKDYSILNARTNPELATDRILMGGLLALFEQLFVFDHHREDARTYQLARPLMLFIGQNVNAGPRDVQQIVAFLHRVLAEPAHTATLIADLLEGRSGLHDAADRDVFATAFTVLKAQGMTSAQLADDLCHTIFHGKGALQLHALKGTDGEIGLRTLDSANDRYFGVISVGDASKFLKDLASSVTGIAVGTDDRMADTVFDTLEDESSPIHILVGARKFVEGWSSWRVSALGLMKVGKGAGAQILQLFGRGVRLRGLGNGLKRSARLAGKHPEHLRVLETFSIFGLESNYLQRFLDELYKEGAVVRTHERILPLKVSDDLLDAELQIIQTPPGYDFRDSEIVRLEVGEQRFTLDLSTTLEISRGADHTRVSQRGASVPLSSLLWLHRAAPFELLWREALAFKQAKGWTNLHLTRDALRAFLATNVHVEGPSDVLEATPDHAIPIFRQALVRLVHKALERAFYQVQQRAESGRVQAVRLTASHANFPTVPRPPTHPGTTERLRAYTLDVPEDLLTQVDALLADVHNLQTVEDVAAPLPRLIADRHLFQPLALLYPTTRTFRGDAPVQLDALKKVASRVRFKPAGLEPGEAQFVADLHHVWERLAVQPSWAPFHLALLRNTARQGVGFFDTAGFYPDFLLWLHRDKKQALAFIDPKGMTHGHWAKVELRHAIEALTPQAGFYLTSFIVTPTLPADIPIPPSLTDQAGITAWLADQHVLLQQGSDYIGALLDVLRVALTP